MKKVKKLIIKMVLKHYIFKYNAYYAPPPAKLLTYLLIAFITVLIDHFLFFKLYSFGLNINIAAPIAFAVSAIINYPFIFFNLIGNRKGIKRSYLEFSIFWLIVIASSFFDLHLTKLFLDIDLGLSPAKIYSIIIILVLNFLVRKIWLYPIGETKIKTQKNYYN